MLAIAAKRTLSLLTHTKQKSTAQDERDVNRVKEEQLIRHLIGLSYHEEEKEREREREREREKNCTCCLHDSIG
jgi:hypothetical protein